MPAASPGGRTLIWVAAVLVTLIALALDSRARLDSIDRATARVLSTPAPDADPSSATGYTWGEHRLILPAIDGYHWALQTERMLAGDGWRIRHAAYDDAPTGREVHWSGVMRWWSAVWAAVDHASHPGDSWGRSVERVAPWANTALLAVLVVLVTPILSMGLGAVPAALFAVGTVAVFPFYEYFVVGYFDHHGIATMSALMCVLFVVAGALQPTRARRWFLASAASGGVSLWINAATIVPILGALGLAAFIVALCVEGEPIDPSLWRVWGAAGAAVGFGLYLLEYFPGHLGLRLEVNNPLYALAWLAGGDLVARVGARDRSSRTAAWVATDGVAILIAPALVFLGGDRFFRLSDPFLLTLHRVFISEFLPLRGQLVQMGAVAIAGRVSPLLLLGLPLAALLWGAGGSGARSAVWRAMLTVVVGSVLAFSLVVATALFGGRTVPAAIAALVVCAALLFAGGVGVGEPLAASTRSALVLALVPAAALALLSLAQVRWVGIDAALWLGVVATAAACAPGDASFRWTTGRKVAAAAVLTGAFVVAPAFYLSLPLDDADPSQEIARDVSWWLRRRIAGRSATVLSSPNATTWMAWFGGFRGIGTLYWENAEGLRAAADMAEAPSADSLHALLTARGVTHIVLFPWEQGFEQLRLSRAAAAGGPKPPGVLPRLVDVMRDADVPELPAWLMPLPYTAPADDGFRHPTALAFELVAPQPRAVALVRLAQWDQAIGAPDRTEAALRASLQVAPNAPAFALLAQLGVAQGNEANVREGLDGLRAQLREDPALDPSDRLNAAIALALGRDGAAVPQLDRVLSEADEGALRRMTPDALAILVQLARQVGLDRTHPDAVRIASALLPPAPPR